MSSAFYKIIHVTGALLLFMALGGILRNPEKNSQGRRLNAMQHGVGLVLLLIAGFGSLARLHIAWPWPGWVWGKALIWCALGGLPALATRRPECKKCWWVLVLGLGAVAAWLAIAKPL